MGFKLTAPTTDEDYDKECLQPIDGHYDYGVQYIMKRNEAKKRELHKQLFSRFGRPIPKISLRFISFNALYF